VAGFVDEWRRVDDLDHYRRTVDVSAQHHAGALGRHDVIWGGGYRATHDVTRGNLFISLSPEHQDYQLASAFAQDEIALAGGRVRATLGGKVEHSEFGGLSLQPTARLYWRMTPGQAVWTAVSRAQRSPDRVERSIRLNIMGFPLPDGMPAVVGLVGNPDVGSEWATSYEVGYRTALGGAATLDVASYYNRYSDLMANVPAEPEIALDGGRPYVFLPSVYANAVNATTAGAEAMVTYTPSASWTLSGSYSLFSIDPEYTGQATAEAFDGLNTPQQHGFVRSSLSLPLAIDLDTTLFMTGRIRSLQQPAYTRVDHRMAWRPRPRVELSLAVRNLFDATHVEFSSPSSVVVEPSQAPRTAYGAIAWRF
jgi:iron complex outermembrane receptor protein